MLEEQSSARYFHPSPVSVFSLLDCGLSGGNDTVTTKSVRWAWFWADGEDREAHDLAVLEHAVVSSPARAHDSIFVYTCAWTCHVLERVC